MKWADRFLDVFPTLLLAVIIVFLIELGVALVIQFAFL